MYCKYCGEEIKRVVKYCPQCGREIQRKRREGGGAFYLLLFLTVLPLLLTLLSTLKNMPHVSWAGIVINVVAAAAGLCLLLALWQGGKIDPSRFHAADALMWLLWIFLPSLSYTLQLRGMFFSDGQYSGIACSMLQTTDLLLGQLGGLWRWIELAVLCMVRSGSLRITAKKAGLTLGVLVAWSALLCAFQGPISQLMAGGIEEIRSFYLVGFGIYFLLLWLRRGFELAFMAMYGGNRLKPGFGILIPVILNLLTIILMPVIMFSFSMGIHGIGLTAAGAYLLSSLVLFLVRAKKESMART